VPCKGEPGNEVRLYRNEKSQVIVETAKYLSTINYTSKPLLRQTSDVRKQ